MVLENSAIGKGVSSYTRENLYVMQPLWATRIKSELA